MCASQVRPVGSQVRSHGLRLLTLFVVGTLMAACSGGGGGGDSDLRAGGEKEGAIVDDATRRALNSGANGPTTAGEIVASSADEWREKWLAAGATVPPPDVNDVDFTKEVVVGLFAGERPSGGWRIGSDVKVKVQGRFAAVIYEVVGPGEGCTTSQALTSPYLVLAVNAEAVRFESSVRTEPCE